MTDQNTLRRLNYLWKHRHKGHDDIERRLTIIEDRDAEDEGTSITDHGKLDGLRDDDHWRYLTFGRHDRHGHRIYYDEFVEAGRVTLVTASIQTATNPTKDSDNPLFPESAEDTGAWDRNKSYASVIRQEDTDNPGSYLWHMFYSGSDTDHTTWRTGYAFSRDGETWIKPNLGLVSFGGNTGNNILRDGIHNHTVYDEQTGLFVSVEEDFSAGDITIYTQEHPRQAPTAVKTLTPSQSNAEGKGIFRRPTDHRWVLYYNHGHGSQDRDIHAFISDTTELDGTWTQYGTVVLDAPDQDNQYYTCIPSVVGDQILCAVTRYDKTNEQLDVDLFTTRNGVDLTKIKDSWIPLGASTAWDDEMVWVGSSIVEEDDSWHIYYLGAPENHAVLNSDRRVGRATVNRERIGSVGTTGTITTDYMHVGPGAILTVNADASGGTLEIEVQDADGNAITGYAQTDFDDITSDAYDHHPTWGQETIESGTIRLVFHLTTNVSVYSFELTNTVPATAVGGGSVSAIDDLSDVDTSTAAPAVDDLLKWDGSNWVPVTPGAPAQDLRSELLMQDGVTNPPVPIETEAQDDWLYADAL